MPDATPFKLVLLKIPVTDLQTAIPFYRDVIGLTLDFVAEEYGWAQFLASDLAVGVYVPGEGGGGRTVGGDLDFHLALPEAAFTALVARLQPAGHLVGNTLQHGDDGTTFAEAEDPSGNRLKVFREMAADS